MSNQLIFIAGSPSQTSRSSRVLEAVGQQLRAVGITSRFYSLADFEPSPLLHGKSVNPALRLFIEAVQASRGIVVATPVYKGTFAGALKVILDVIPPDALVGKVALGIATARLASHLEGAGSGLAGIFDFFQIKRQAPPLLLTDEGLTDAQDPAKLSEATLSAVRESAARIQAFLV